MWLMLRLFRLALWASRALCAVGVLLAATACDPVSEVRVRGLTRPAPNTDCLARALANSPFVATFHQSTDTRNPGLDVALRDPLKIEAIDPDAHVRLVTGKGDTTEVEVSFVLYGRPTWGVDKEDSRRLESIGNGIARDVIKSCAPGSPEKLSCRVAGWPWSRSCS